MILDRDSAAFDIAGLVQALAKRLQVRLPRTWRGAVEESNDWHRRLLRAPRERPSRRRAADQRDELAPSHAGHGASSPVPE